MKKTNKLWLALLLTVLVASLLAVGFTAAAEEPEIVDSGTSWTLDSNGLLILNSTGGLYDTLFEGRTDVKNVVILDGEDMIDAGMFAGCSNLKSIAIPTSVEIIEISAFDGCSALSYVFYSGTPEQWDQIWIYGYLEDMDDAHAAYAQSVRDHLNAIVRFNTVDWGYCGGEGDGTNLTWTLDNAGTLTISGTGAMADYTSASDAPWYSVSASIQSVVVEEGVTSIGAGAFSSGNFGDYAGTLMYVTIPKSVAQIGERAFGLCCSLQRFTVDADNACYASDDSGCLFNKDKTTLIQYPAGNPRTSFTIPDGVTTIGDWAFDDCLSLASVAMPNSVTHIGNCAFAYCGSLTNITLSKSLTTIGYHAFGECSITSIRIPDGVTSVGTNLFFCCNELKTVSLPASLTSIGGGTFFNCGALTNVFYGGSKAQWTAVFESENDPVENANIHYNIIDWGYCNNNVIWMVDADGTLTISGNGSIPLYGDYSDGDLNVDTGTPWYRYRDSIKTLVMEEGIILIGLNAFTNCTSLETVYVPTSLTDVYEVAFYKCSAIKDVYYAGTAAQWSSIRFAEIDPSMPNGNEDFLNADRHYYIVDWGYCGEEDNVQSVSWKFTDDGKLIISGTGKMQYPWREQPWNQYSDRIEAVVIEEGVTNIWWAAFDGYTALKEVSIADSVSRIEYYTFCECSSLESVKIPEGVKSIEMSTFNVCESLKTLALPASLTKVMEFAFSGCTSLADVFYAGSEEQWNRMQYIDPYQHGQYISFGNADENAYAGIAPLLNANIHFNVVDWGYCGAEDDGTNLVWCIDKNSTLTVSGTGAMANYSDSEPAPWNDCFAAPGASITVVLEEGVTTIGTKAFPNTGLNELIVLNKQCDLDALEIRDPAMLRGYLESTAKDYADKYDKLSTFKPLCDVDYRHTVEVIEGVDSTCMEPGHTPGLHCVECDKYFYGCEALPLENHAWGDWVTTKQPTTETEGVRTRTCTTPGCGATETQTIEKLTPTDNGGSDSNDDDDDGGFFGWLQRAMKGLVAWFKKLLQFFK